MWRHSLFFMQTDKGNFVLVKSASVRNVPVYVSACVSCDTVSKFEFKSIALFSIYKQVFLNVILLNYRLMSAPAIRVRARVSELFDGHGENRYFFFERNHIFSQKPIHFYEFTLFVTPAERNGEPSFALY